MPDVDLSQVESYLRLKEIAEQLAKTNTHLREANGHLEVIDDGIERLDNAMRLILMAIVGTWIVNWVIITVTIYVVFHWLSTIRLSMPLY